VRYSFDEESKTLCVMLDRGQHHELLKGTLPGRAMSSAIDLKYKSLSEQHGSGIEIRIIVEDSSRLT
jgi:hypothetical protein